MPMYWQDFEEDTPDLDATEIGVYMKLIRLAWSCGKGCVPGDMQQLKLLLQRVIARFHGRTFNAIVPKLLKRYFYVGEDGNYYQNRVVKELEKMKQIADRQSHAANKRWSEGTEKAPKESRNGAEKVPKDSRNNAETTAKESRKATQLEQN
jgi:uncharacterized protein YdaU (DUF1376 family)